VPLYRLCQIYGRDGVDMSRSTITDMMGNCALMLTPLADALGRYVLKAGKVHGDDTPIRALGGKGKTARTARLWVYVRDDRPSADKAPPAVWFQYSPDRQGEHPQRHLKNFSGVLQADAFAGYDKLYTDGRILEAGCWSHYPERCFIWCNGPPGQVLRGGSQSRSPHKIRRFRGTARRQEGPPWASTPWYSPARCLPSSRTPASHRASSAGWS
jgi:Transposase IS66 family